MSFLEIYRTTRKLLFGDKSCNRWFPSHPSLLCGITYTRLTSQSWEYCAAVLCYCQQLNCHLCSCYWFSLWSTVRECTHDLSPLRWKSTTVQYQRNLLPGRCWACVSVSLLTVWMYLMQCFPRVLFCTLTLCVISFSVTIQHFTLSYIPGLPYFELLFFYDKHFVMFLK